MVLCRGDDEDDNDWLGKMNTFFYFFAHKMGNKWPDVKMMYVSEE